MTGDTEMIDYVWRIERWGGEVHGFGFQPTEPTKGDHIPVVARYENGTLIGAAMRTADGTWKWWVTSIRSSEKSGVEQTRERAQQMILFYR